MAESKETETIVLGGGCFWCIEAVFQRLKGVEKVTSGYSGGQTKNPTYREVSSGKTGHAEVIKVDFDPKIVSAAEILDLFWRAHDPTTLNRQGADVGTQYRSTIYYTNDAQKQEAERSKTVTEKELGKKVVTEIEPLGDFYVAEDYHQNYFNENAGAPYCQMVIRPKLEKLKMPIEGN